VIRSAIETAQRHGKPVIVDPKAADYTAYRGATVITPNSKEILEATRRRATSLKDIASAATDSPTASARKPCW
jgi:D-beta-D-heptose 7-phosphate kinase/D-beta-D-heptose 1-phosphate adenosyltransferase